MNEKFYSLSEEKQQAIINGGYWVFSRNSYKKSPVSEIAEAAGISKSLLFYYFQNKRELYLFLWDTCTRLTSAYLKKYRCYEPPDIFEMMRRGLNAKVHLMRRYPDLGAFALKAYYEKDPAVYRDLQKSIAEYTTLKENMSLPLLDPAQFIPGLDLNMMYQDMYLASEGYFWRVFSGEGMDIDQIENDFEKMIDFWKQVYLRKEDSHGCD